MAKTLLEGLYIKRREQDRTRKNALVACNECGCTVLCPRPADVERVLKSVCSNCNDSSRAKRQLAYALIDQIRASRRKRVEVTE
jgi:hypothetical protein